MILHWVKTPQIENIGSCVIRKYLETVEMLTVFGLTVYMLLIVSWLVRKLQQLQMHYLTLQITKQLVYISKDCNFIYIFFIIVYEI